jgi:PAS domain S-box-containing protein
MLSTLTLPSTNSDSCSSLAEPMSLIQRLINQVNEAILCVDFKGHFYYINDAACSLLGYSREKLLKMNIDEIELDFLPSSWSHYWQLIKQKSSLTFKALRSSPQYKSLEVTIKFLEHGSERLGCILAHPVSTNTPELSEDDFVRAKENNSFLFEAKSSSIDQFYPNCVQLKEIFKFIEQNYHQPITPTDVADAVGYSPAYLSDLVKRRTQRTITNWILERKMLEARSLLIKTNKSVTEIAMAVGFTDPYYFSRRFRQSHKISPRSWRQQHQLQSA